MKINFKPLRAKFLAGLLVTVPMIATILALKLLFQSIDGLVGSLPERIFGYPVPGFGILVTTLVVLFMGFLASNFAGRKFIGIGEKLFVNIPLVSKIYLAAKELMQAITLPNRMLFKAVVIVEYPRKGLFAYGFITSETEHRTEAGIGRLVNVFIPSVPMPTTGFLVAIPEKEVVKVNISVEEALKLVVSGGLVSPKFFQEVKSIEKGAAS